MKSEVQSTLEVNREVRRVFVAHWIDLGRLSIHTMKDRVHIRGSLLKLPGADAVLTPSAVDIIGRKIASSAGSRRLKFELDNWRLNEATGAWEQTIDREKRQMFGIHGREQTGPSQTSFDVTD